MQASHEGTGASMAAPDPLPTTRIAEMDPGLSVVVPLYNGRLTILDTLNSLLRQSVPLRELVVVDDCSTDDGGTRVEAMAASEPRLRYVRLESRTGVARARNIGASLTSGQWIGFCDNDDLWHKDVTASLASALTASPDIQCLGVEAWGFALEADRRALIGSERSAMVRSWVPSGEPKPIAWLEGQTLGVRLQDRTVLRNDLNDNSRFVTTQVLVRRDAFVRAGGFNPLILGADEWHLHAALAEMSPIPVMGFNGIYYRVRPSAGSHDQSAAAERLLASMTFLRLGGAEPDHRVAGELYAALIRSARTRVQPDELVAWTILGDFTGRERRSLLMSILKYRMLRRVERLRGPHRRRLW